MAALSLVLSLHRSYILKPYSFLDIGAKQPYFDIDLTEERFRNGIENSQSPIIEILSKHLKDSHSKFKIGLSISGITLEMIARDEPIFLKELKSLSKTGKIEFLCTPYYHSLACLYSMAEFDRQVLLHKAIVKKYFGKEPKVFHNTGLIFDDMIAERLVSLKLSGAIMEGVGKIVPNPNFVYQTQSSLPVLTRNFGLSDNLTFRNWHNEPFNASQYGAWINQIQGDVVSLFVDWDLFGVHHKRESGIFDFFEQLINQPLEFLLPSEAITKFEPKQVISVPDKISWFGVEKDLAGWIGSNMQTDALQKLYGLEPFIKKGSDDIGTWSALQSANYFQNMGLEIPKAQSPYEAFIYYMNILSDFDERVRPQPLQQSPKTKKSQAKATNSNAVRLKPRSV